MKTLSKWSLFLILLVSGLQLQAQVPGGAGLNSVITKLFGTHDDFTVDSEFHILDPKMKPTVSMTLEITVSGGKMRADLDVSNMKGAGITPQMLQQYKKMGVDRSVTIVRPDKKAVILLFPSRKLYEQTPLPKEVSSSAAVSKIKKTPLGKETMDGHPCVKNKVVLVDSKGKTQEMTTWEATDLKNFPIQVQLVDNGQNTLVHNRNIKFGKPSHSLFEIPTGYTKGYPK